MSYRKNLYQEKITQGGLFVQPPVHLTHGPSSRSPIPRHLPQPRCRSRVLRLADPDPGRVLARRRRLRRARLALPRRRAPARRARGPQDADASRCAPPLGAFVLGAVVYALDSALFFGALERTSAPLASLVHYAHLVLVVGVAAMIGRERLTRRRLLALAGIFGGVALVGGAAVNPDLLGLGMALGAGGRLRRLHPALRPAAARHRSAGARRLPHRRRGDVVPRRRRRARLARHGRRLLRASSASRPRPSSARCSP